ncbi:hypothetical protein YC2023_064971 [Brassica napus]
MESGFVNVVSSLFVRELKHATSDRPKYIEVYSWFEGMWLGYGYMRNKSALLYGLLTHCLQVGHPVLMVIDAAVGKFGFWLVKWIDGFDFKINTIVLVSDSPVISQIFAVILFRKINIYSTQLANNYFQKNRAWNDNMGCIWLQV